jgi:hypothetical protein
VSTWAAAFAAAAFAALAALHGYWALGGFWPGRDSESLARTVVGSPPGSAAPGPGPCWLVAVLLLGAAATVLGAAGLLPLPVPAVAVRWAALLGAAVLLVRGLEGFADRRIRPASVGSPFARLNVLLYSPLCLLLSLLTFLAATPP